MSSLCRAPPETCQGLLWSRLPVPSSTPSQGIAASWGLPFSPRSTLPMVATLYHPAGGEAQAGGDLMGALPGGPSLHAHPSSCEPQPRLLDLPVSTSCLLFVQRTWLSPRPRVGLAGGRKLPLRGCLGCGEGAPRASPGETRRLHRGQGRALGWGGVRSRPPSC